MVSVVVMIVFITVLMYKKYVGNIIKINFSETLFIWFISAQIEIFAERQSKKIYCFYPNGGKHCNILFIPKRLEIGFGVRQLFSES